MVIVCRNQKKKKKKKKKSEKIHDIPLFLLEFKNYVLTTKILYPNWFS